jgi:hypothetical protein
MGYSQNNQVNLFTGVRLENLQTNINQPQPITRQISMLAGELNIARRNCNAYPSGHPMVEASIQKLATAWQALYTTAPSIRIGITKEGLLVDDLYIDKGNAACKMLAATLFERGVGTIQVLTPPSPSELREMLDILAMKREDILSLEECRDQIHSPGHNPLRPVQRHRRWPA